MNDLKISALSDEIADVLKNRIPVLNECPIDTLAEIIHEAINDFNLQFTQISKK